MSGSTIQLYCPCNKAWSLLERIQNQKHTSEHKGMWSISEFSRECPWEIVCVFLPQAMLPRLNWLRLVLFGMLGAVSLVTQAEESDKTFTFSHVYRTDSGCKQALQAVLPSQDQASEGQVMMVDGEKDIVFKHSIKFSSSRCNCTDSEEFKALLYRVNVLEEEVTYLKSQCAQGCCRGSSGISSHANSAADSGSVL